MSSDALPCRPVVTVSDSKVKKKDRPHVSWRIPRSGATVPSGIPKRIYETELVRLQEELVKMTEVGEDLR